MKHYRLYFKKLRRKLLTNSKQLACQAYISKKKHTEKTETTGKADSLTNLIGSLERLSAEINNLLQEQPHNKEALADLNQEAAIAYAKLTVFYEKLRNKNTSAKDT